MQYKVFAAVPWRDLKPTPTNAVQARPRAPSGEDTFRPELALRQRTRPAQANVENQARTVGVPLGRGHVEDLLEVVPLLADEPRKDLIQVLPDLSPKLIGQLLMGHCQRPGYLRAVARGGMRVDLHGQPAGEVTPEAQTHAAAQLKVLTAEQAKTVVSAFVDAIETQTRGELKHSLHVVGDERVEDRIRDLVADLVRMTFRHRLTREHVRRAHHQPLIRRTPAALS